MMQIMLCGAHDVGELSDAFTEVVHDFGAEPWCYQQGRIRHINSATSRWDENSRASVAKADICVFVILDRYGEITWNHELLSALDLGKPFVVLALESAWIRYTNLLHALTDHDHIENDDDRRMVGLLRMISSDYQITVAPFTYAAFKERLRRELSDMFRQCAQLVEIRNRRKFLIQLTGGTAPPSRHQVDELIALAMDEYEDNKIERKTALRRLAAAQARDDELVRAGARSHEQGIQRLTFDLLPDLLPLPVDDDLLRELAIIAGTCDDVGIARRFLLAVAKIKPTLLDTVLEAIGVSEEGVRRRAFEGLEENWSEVVDEWGPERTARFLSACEATTAARASWIQRLRQKRSDLERTDKADPSMSAMTGVTAAFDRFGDDR